MRLAAIDLGTNTVHFLVAEVDAPPAWKLVHHEQRVTRIGEGLSRDRRLGEGPMARTTDVVAGDVHHARALGATAVRIVATSAVRDADNGREFARGVERATGIPLEIVSGENEARLMLRGVLYGLGRPRGTLLVFDIGGGSTEYVLARDRAVALSVSLRLGVVPLAERFPFPHAVDASRYRALEAEVTARLERELPPEIAAAPLDHLVGTAGTVTALAALDLELPAYDRERVQGHRLTRAAVERLRTRLAALTLAERGDLPCLEPARADLIVPGTAIVLATMTAIGADALIVSDAGLREGIVDDTVARLAAGEA